MVSVNKVEEPTENITCSPQKDDIVSLVDAVSPAQNEIKPETTEKTKENEHDRNSE